MKSIVLLGIVALEAWAGLRAGAGTSDLTAPIGAAMAGYFFNRASTGMHDPLLARAVVLDNDGVRIALVSCDLTSMPEGIAREARQLIEAATGIPAKHVMVFATHAHTAPVILSGWSRYALEGEMKRMAEDYARGLPARIAASVFAAVGRLRPAKLMVATGEEKSQAFNRRYFTRNGSVRWNPGKLNPEVVKAAGPIDPAVAVAYVEGEDGVGIAMYVNHAIHLDTVGGTEYSADLTFALGEALKAARGGQLVTLFGMGCAGNVNHIDTGSSRKQGGHREAARIGVALAAATLKALDGAKVVEHLKLGAQSRRVRLGAVVASAEDIAEAQGPAPAQAGTEVLAKRARILEIAARQGKEFEAEVQVLQAGADVAWVGLPGEIFVELGLLLKQGSTASWTAVNTQANGSIGYVPDARAYPQGAYEVLSARVQAGSGEALVDEAVRQIARLKKSLLSSLAEEK